MLADEKVKLYQSLFRGREDIFARRWEKGIKSGYSPAYSFDWDEFNTYRSQGGKLKDFENKTPIPLTNSTIHQHLLGQIVAGIYPILENNTSYFLAADFDHANWLDDCKNYQEEMKRLGLMAYIERSRSGNGGHVWVFFAEAYPCHKSRAIGFEVARKVLNLSAFDKEASFDRLFPSQDVITKNGLGNLIALPFQGRSVKDGNTVFMDPNTNEPFDDQFKVLKSIKRHLPLELEVVYQKVIGDDDDTSFQAKSKKLKITVGQNIALQKSQVSGVLVGFLKEQLNFLNTEYLTKKRLGMSLYQVQKYFRLIDESPKAISLPCGFL